MSQKKEAEAAHKYGIAYLGSNPPRLQSASIEFRKAISADPQYKDAHYALGHVQFQQQEYEAAARSFQKAIEIDMNFSDAHNYLGKTYEQQGDVAHAIAEYQEALSNLQYDSPQKPHLNLGLLYLRTKDYAQALSAFQSVLRLNPQHAVALKGVGQSHFFSSNVTAAVRSYQEALQEAPDYFDAHYNLATAYAQQGNIALAMAEFKRVIALAPLSDEAVAAKRFLEANPQ